MDIKEIGNIIMHDKVNRDRKPTGNSFNKENSQRKEPRNDINRPGTTDATDQSMQSNSATAEWSVKSNLSTNQFNISHPEQSSQASLKEGTINDSAEEKSKSLGEVACEQLFNNYKPELPYTEFMGSLKKVITYEQFQQLNNDILR